ncbi:MAG: DegT/DnrJ/EryC1/StrS family aminotransferase [Lentisphaeria bacterium]
MSDFKKTVTTPVCRIVAGGPGVFRTKDFDNNPLVYKSGPMSDMQAALGLAQLERYSDFINRRRVLKQTYTQSLQEISIIDLPESLPDFLFRFPIRHTSGLDFGDIQSRMAGHGVHVRRGVDALLHRELGLPDKGFSSAVQHLDQTFSIPYYPALEDCESGQVVSSLLEVFN